jgi:GGDEF domain-containing protein
MALDYEAQTKFQSLAPVLEHFTDWFGRIALAAAYVNDGIIPDKIETPKSFSLWIKTAYDNADFKNATLQDVEHVYDEMVKASEGLVSNIMAQRKPTHEEFIDFKNIYDAFLTRVRRLERDSASEGSGYDELTGLRNIHVFKGDIRREMERLSRQGNPFCLVMARIDKFAGFEDPQANLMVAVENIKECIRTFDDAYYLENGEFLLSLKHTDTVGAQAAIARLQQFLKIDDNNKEKLSMSFCVAEPVVPEELEGLLDNMRQDLDDHLNDEEAVLQFVEASPLKRFVDSME